MECLKLNYDKNLHIYVDKKVTFSKRFRLLITSVWQNFAGKLQYIICFYWIDFRFKDQILIRTFVAWFFSCNKGIFFILTEEPRHI